MAQIDFQIGISGDQGDGFSVQRVFRIESELRFPLVGHTVIIGVKRFVRCLQLRPSSHLGLGVNQFAGGITHIIDNTRVDRIAMERTAGFGEHGLVGFVGGLLDGQGRQAVGPA